MGSPTEKIALTNMYREAGIANMSTTAEVPVNILNPSLENQIRVAEINLTNLQELIKTLCAFNQRVLGDEMLGIAPMPENPIMITGQLQRLHWLQFELSNHLATIRGIINVITEV